jgi:phosphonoacetate hydrolase
MPKAARVVVVVFDGLRPDMVTPDRMPALAAFADQGLWFREARSVFPSVTRVATSSIASGAPPAVHGVVGNAFLFPEVTREHVFDTTSPDDLALARARLGDGLVTAETLGDRLAAAGLSFAVVHTGSAGSAYCINPRAAAHGHWTYSVQGERHTPTPAAVREVMERFGEPPARRLPRSTEMDYAARVFTDHVLHSLKPDVALVWFAEPDTSFHYLMLDSADARTVMGTVDAAFARILAAVQSAPDAAGTAIIVASDHGQISNRGAVAMDALLTAAGHPAAMAAERRLDHAKVAVTGGGMGEIRVLDGDRDRRDAIARWLMTRDEIGMVFTASDDPVRGAVEGTFSTRLVALDHARGPDLVYVLRSSSETDPYGLPGLCLVTAGDVPVGGGMHGGLNRHELNTVLILGGAAARPGRNDAPVGIVDIAPTILDFVGVAPAPGMTGVSLLDRGSVEVVGEAETFEAGVGGFRQRLIVRRRGAHVFPMDGGRS